MEKLTSVKGGKIVKSTPISPVMITRGRVVGRDTQTIELQLEQMFEPSKTNPSNGLLAFAMEGHTAFNSGPRKKVAWQNFSVEKLKKLGIIQSHEEIASSKIELEATATTPASTMMGAKLMNKELILRDSAGVVIPCRLVEVDTFTAREWADRMTGNMVKQQPKRAGAMGDVLTRDAAPIYRNSLLSIPGMDDVNTGKAWDEDLVIIHNNPVVGSTVRGALDRAGMGVQEPKLPGGTTENVADQNFQNRQPGDTGNLKETRSDEPTRTQPSEEVQGAANKTKAEQQREAGQRPAAVQPS